MKQEEIIGSIVTFLCKTEDRCLILVVSCATAEQSGKQTVNKPSKQESEGDMLCRANFSTLNPLFFPRKGSGARIFFLF